MRSFTGLLVVLTVLVLPRLSPGQALGPDAYFNSTAAALQAIPLIPLAPAPWSPAQVANVQILYTVMNTATPQMVAQAQFDATPSVFDFSDVLGPGFTARNLPLTNAFFNKVTTNVENVNVNLDLYYNSPGPVSAASYPSAHTLLGLVDGMLLGFMVPERQGDLLAYGVQYGLNRLILGQHWPTDVAAGQMETAILVPDLLLSTQFQSDFTAAKAELRAQQGLE